MPDSKRWLVVDSDTLAEARKDAKPGDRVTVAEDTSLGVIVPGCAKKHGEFVVSDQGWRDPNAPAPAPSKPAAVPVVTPKPRLTITGHGTIYATANHLRAIARAEDQFKLTSLRMTGDGTVVAEAEAVAEPASLTLQPTSQQATLVAQSDGHSLVWQVLDADEAAKAQAWVPLTGLPAERSPFFLAGWDLD